VSYSSNRSNRVFLISISRYVGTANPGSRPPTNDEQHIHSLRVGSTCGCPRRREAAPAGSHEADAEIWCGVNPAGDENPASLECSLRLMLQVCTGAPFSVGKGKCVWKNTYLIDDGFCTLSDGRTDFPFPHVVERTGGGSQESI